MDERQRVSDDEEDMEEEVRVYGRGYKVHASCVASCVKHLNTPTSWSCVVVVWWVGVAIITQRPSSTPASTTPLLWRPLLATHKHPQL